MRSVLQASLEDTKSGWGPVSLENVSKDAQREADLGNGIMPGVTQGSIDPLSCF